MIIQLTPNVPKLAMHFDRVIAIYVKDNGAGNLRMGTSREELQKDVSLAPGQIADGITQNAAQNFQLYFWSGDLWIISDQADAITIIASAATFHIDRFSGPRQQPSDVVGDVAAEDLSTYGLS